MSIDTDWEFKASHWEREAKRLIEENNSLKNELLLSEARQTMEAALSLPVSNTDIDRTSEPKGHWQDGGKVWVEDHVCCLPGEWQPIETYVIVNSGPYTPHVFCAHKEKKWMRMGRYDVTLKRWYYSGTNERSQWAQVEGDEPTHWQPLPEPPL